MVQAEMAVANMIAIAAGSPRTQEGVSALTETPQLGTTGNNNASEISSEYRATTIAMSLVGSYIP